MDGLIGLMQGFEVVFTWQTLALALIGCLTGMLVGILPGVGQSAGMALLIPITYHLDPAGAIIMLASIFYGAAYGGTITSILMNIPGESESIVTTFDGYPLAKQGKAGIALSISAIGSFVGGTCATIALALVALPISRLALQLGPPEYATLMLLGLTLAAGLLGSSIIKGLMMVVFGLLLSQIGTDPALGLPRFTFGNTNLLDGIPLLALIMGFYGLSDVLLSLFKPLPTGGSAAKISRLMPRASDLRESAGPIARGTLIGGLLGILPGMASAVSTFFSYAVERRVSKTPELFGKGALAGVAGPETANNSFANASFLPLMTLGIPGSAALSILFGALMIQGVTPGPLMFRDHPDVAWGLIASMIVGNGILLALSFPLIGIWVSILRLPATLIGAIIVVVSLIGVYTVQSNPFDILALAFFTLVGAGLKWLNYPLAPAILAFILGKPIESALGQSLNIAQGDFTIFLTRPISACFIAAAALIIAMSSIRLYRDARSAK
ncbi:tripartite tricarboxylate transporter permease [Aureimonas fodinaquatilis]|uniref:Tripartite tricarboxylate transporter permease n=1 Tax=Aureimonas fodinaquatilis TaxID=2565783 RepID=A0A5B0DRB7_9HYPH|nr:tripartite tricarboxylate transporter permease [Aureimonas fodinaquatilis]KAA0969337.1 tripartite tricarboxylate transporter permease [Aureimonas fodinaquatilis]